MDLKFQQTITSAYADPDLCHDMVGPSHNAVKPKLSSEALASIQLQFVVKYTNLICGYQFNLSPSISFNTSHIPMTYLLSSATELRSIYVS